MGIVRKVNKRHGNVYVEFAKEESVQKVSICYNEKDDCELIFDILFIYFTEGGKRVKV